MNSNKNALTTKTKNKSFTKYHTTQRGTPTKYGKLKPVERRLATLKKHIEQSDIYFKYKGKKKLTEAEQILFTAAKDYLKGVMNGKTTIPTKTWKTEYAKLTNQRNALNQRYLVLKEEVKEAEQIRKSVYSILRQAQQPHKAQDIER